MCAGAVESYCLRVQPGHGHRMVPLGTGKPQPFFPWTTGTIASDWPIVKPVYRNPNYVSTPSNYFFESRESTAQFTRGTSNLGRHKQEAFRTRGPRPSERGPGFGGSSSGPGQGENKTNVFPNLRLIELSLVIKLHFYSSNPIWALLEPTRAPLFSVFQCLEFWQAWGSAQGWCASPSSPVRQAR